MSDWTNSISGIGKTTQARFGSLEKGLSRVKNAAINGNLDLPNMLSNGVLNPEDKDKVSGVYNPNTVAAYNH